MKKSLVIVFIVCITVALIPQPSLDSNARGLTRGPIKVKRELFNPLRFYRDTIDSLKTKVKVNSVIIKKRVKELEKQNEILVTEE